MIVLKAFAMLIATLLTLLAAVFVMRQAQVAKVKVKSRDPRASHQVRRLRQDPRTGVYYPAD